MLQRWRSAMFGGAAAMKLAKLSEFRETFFTPSSAPATSTLRRQIERGELLGGTKVGYRYSWTSTSTPGRPTCARTSSPSRPTWRRTRCWIA